MQSDGRQHPMVADDEPLSGAGVVGYALALGLSAILMAVAIESPRHWWLGWITLLPVLQAARSLRPRQAFAAGSYWGAALFFACVALAKTGVQPAWWSFAILLVIPGAYAGLAAALTRQIGFSPYLLALGWIGVEFSLRPAGLSHGLLSGTQEGGVLVYGIGRFAGYLIVAFLVAYINASLLDILHEVRGRLTPPRPVASSVGPVRPFVRADVPFISSRQLCISQPRAPPA